MSRPWNAAQRTLLVATLASFATTYRASSAFASLVDVARRYDASNDTTSGIVEDRDSGERYYWFVNHRSGESDLWALGAETAETGSIRRAKPR